MQFLEERRDVDDDARANQIDTLWIDETGRENVKLVGYVIGNNGMAGIVATLCAGTEVGRGAENVDEFAFSCRTVLPSVCEGWDSCAPRHLLYLHRQTDSPTPPSPSLAVKNPIDAVESALMVGQVWESKGRVGWWDEAFVAT